MSIDGFLKTNPPKEDLKSRYQMEFAKHCCPSTITEEQEVDNLFDHLQQNLRTEATQTTPELANAPSFTAPDHDETSLVPGDEKSSLQLDKTEYQIVEEDLAEDQFVRHRNVHDFTDTFTDSFEVPPQDFIHNTVRVSPSVVVVESCEQAEDPLKEEGRRKFDSHCEQIVNSHSQHVLSNDLTNL